MPGLLNEICGFNQDCLLKAGNQNVNIAGEELELNGEGKQYIVGMKMERRMMIERYKWEGEI